MFELRDVVKTYGDGTSALHAVDGISLTINQGEFVVIEGPSGSGKSTLLQMLGALDRPSSGSVLFEGHDLATMGDGKLATLRLRTFGFVFQQFNLVPTLSAVENIEAALAPLGGSRAKKHQRALRLLNGVGLSDRADHLPSQLSGGEQQRVAIARALSKGPRVILADEPTGNLDTRTGAEIMSILRRLSRENGQTVVLITHDPEIAARAPRVVRVRDGRVVADASGRELIEAAQALPARPTLPPIVSHVQPPAQPQLGERPLTRGGTLTPTSAPVENGKWVPTASTPRWTTDPLLHAEGVVKHYVSVESEEDVVGIDGVSLIVHEGEFVAITGPSGSGKTTLLNCLSGLDRIDRGRVLITGQTVHDLSDKDQSHLRSEVMGFIFQNWNLVPVFSAVENVELPLLLNGLKPDDARKQAIATLERIGLGHRINHHPNALSGGEQQRVAIARALAANPALVWADEPTGNLDSATAESVMKLLRELNDDGLAIVLVTHDESIAEQATRRLFIRDGKLLADMTRRDAIRGKNREPQRPSQPRQQQPPPTLDLRQEAPAPHQEAERKAPMGKAERREARRQARMNTQPRKQPQPPMESPQPISYDDPFA
ncbi:MAG TPA: ATP-binding cassette domain-containing protein [Acidimicrobiales bacterium]|nr:ATP-binding cassette domain-containing protein [Acidimicrobiales bacterium]